MTAEKAIGALVGVTLLLRRVKKWERGITERGKVVMKEAVQ